MASSTRFTSRIRPSTPPPHRGAGVVAGLDLSGYATTPAIADADGGREDRSRSRADRVEGPEPANATFEGTARELLRAAAAAAHSSDGRDDVQSRRAARRSRLACHVHRIRRRRLWRAEGQPPHEPAAARHARRQDPAHRSRPARAHGDEHGQRERAIPDPERTIRFRRWRARGRRSGRTACATRIG